MDLLTPPPTPSPPQSPPQSPEHPPPLPAMLCGTKRTAAAVDDDDEDDGRTYVVALTQSIRVQKAATEQTRLALRGAIERTVERCTARLQQRPIVRDKDIDALAELCAAHSCYWGVSCMIDRDVLDAISIEHPVDRDTMDEAYDVDYFPDGCRDYVDATDAAPWCDKCRAREHRKGSPHRIVAWGTDAATLCLYCIKDFVRREIMKNDWTRVEERVRALLAHPAQV